MRELGLESDDGKVATVVYLQVAKAKVFTTGPRSLPERAHCTAFTCTESLSFLLNKIDPSNLWTTKRSRLLYTRLLAPAPH
jgi:hypothetical protein